MVYLSVHVFKTHRLNIIDSSFESGNKHLICKFNILSY